MATTKLRIYNAALSLCGETGLVDLSEEREARYALDRAFDNGLIKTCLEAGQWNFAIRSSALDPDDSIQTDFGYSNAFPLPVDYVRFAGVCEDEYYECPLQRYQIERGMIFSDLDQIYIRYVSDDAEYGMDMSLWPETFCRYVEATLAFNVCLDINQSDTKQMKLEVLMKKKLDDAMNKDSQAEPAILIRSGGWATSRRRRCW